MNIIDRLELIRKNEDLNKSEFEKILGKSSGYLGILKNKGGVPGGDVLIKVVECFQKYNPKWVLTGNGAMYLDETAENIIQEPKSIYENETELLIILRQQLVDKERIIKMQEEIISELKEFKSKRHTG